MVVARLAAASSVTQLARRSAYRPCPLLCSSSCSFPPVMLVAPAPPWTLVLLVLAATLIRLVVGGDAASASTPCPSLGSSALNRPCGECAHGSSAQCLSPACLDTRQSEPGSSGAGAEAGRVRVQAMPLPADAGFAPAIPRPVCANPGSTSGMPCSLVRGSGVRASGPWSDGRNSFQPTDQGGREWPALRARPTYSVRRLPTAIILRLSSGRGRYDNVSHRPHSGWQLGARSMELSGQQPVTCDTPRCRLAETR